MRERVQQDEREREGEGGKEGGRDGGLSVASATYHKAPAVRARVPAWARSSHNATEVRPCVHPPREG
jgi:hypothetical protein